MQELRWLTWVPIGLLAGLLLLALLLPGASIAVALPLAVTGALVGVPHGAVDHLVPAWWAAAGNAHVSRPPGARVAVFVVAYAALASAVLALMLLFPAPTVVAFLVLSVVHFGRAEAVTWAERAARPVPAVTSEWSVSLAHGLAVVGLLVWAHPASTDPYLRSFSPALAQLADQTRDVGLVLVVLVAARGGVVLLRARRWLDLAELALVTTTFAVAPPLAAFGLYFGGWHAPRHTARLLDLARGARGASGPAAAAGSGWGPATARLGRSAVLPTAAALAAVAGLWAARDVASIQAEVGVLLALTFPHAAVVWVLDQRAAATGPGGAAVDPARRLRPPGRGHVAWSGGRRAAGR